MTSLYEAQGLDHESISSHVEMEGDERARIIAGKGDFRSIRHELEMEGLLSDEVARVTKQYHDELSEIGELTERDMEMLTILDLYDPGTAAHCVDTFRIAREKVTKRLSSGIILEELFARELVSTEEFFRACLLHDIGKVEIPRFVIDHPMNDSVMDLYLRDLLFEEHDPQVAERVERAGGTSLPGDPAAISEYLREHHLRAVHFVPARLVLSPDEVAELEARGFNADLSLMDIIKEHELHSRQILAAEGLRVESELAGAHHNYHKKGTHYPIALGALHASIDVAELLHIADIEQALSACRSYKQGFSMSRVLRIIMEEAQMGRIDPEAAYLWVDDELHSLSEREELTSADRDDLRFVHHALACIRHDIEEDLLGDGWREAA